MMPRPPRLSRTTPLLALALAACAAPGAEVPGLGPPEITRIRAEAPPGAAPGTCWGREVTPAVIETVTEQVRVQPPAPADGGPQSPDVYRTETRQRIVRERRELWFRTPCPEEQTPEFLASLQRALAARGLHDGPVTGVLDAATRRAIRAYQQPEGLDSGILSLAAARRLGLAVVEIPGAGAETVPVPQPPAG